LAHRDCKTCCGEVTLWYRGDDVMRVTARKDQWGEVENNTKDGKPGWICNTCRFDKKQTSDWVIEGPMKVQRHSVISQGHYVKAINGHEALTKVMGGREPKLLMDIHSISDVNKD
ncbi:MAG TPA: Fe-S-binding domain-containing protein, partial [Chitinophagaceae bacterium]|nr:Fe-S-binding domain-containing protein [Chitinophagaceae bacterium]